MNDCWTITLISGETETVLHNGIALVGGVDLVRELMLSNAGGVPKYNASPKCNPVEIVLEQPFGHDKTLFEMAGMLDGFKLKLTLSVPDAKAPNGRTDLLDINIPHLVPSQFGIQAILRLVSNTLSPVEIAWIEEPPVPIPVNVGKKKK